MYGRKPSTLKQSYSEVVISLSATLPLPAEGQGEQRRDLWVAGIQHDSSLEAGWSQTQI